MSFQTGGATDPVDLLNKWKTFLAAAGWTVDQDFAQGTGRVCSVSKGTKHVTMRSFIGETSAYLGAAISGIGGAGIAVTMHSAAYVVPGTPANWWNQAGAPFLYNQNPSIQVMSAVMGLPAGAITNYWAFADAAGDNCVLVAFKGSGVYSHVYFGDMVKVQAWTGGPYFGASSNMFTAFGAVEPGNDLAAPPPGGMQGNPVGFLRADVDSFVNKWVSLTNSRAPGTITATGKAMMSSTAGTVGTTGEALSEHVFYNALRLRARSSLTAGLLLLPTHWLVERDFGGNIFGGGWSLAGTIPGVFQTSGDGFVPGSTYSVSTDDYVTFPTFAVRKIP